ncbi:MAG: transposase [bacterium]|nr:transposase [bacterium]
MKEWCNRYSVEIWVYCLMPNHVHLIAVPQTKEGLSRAIGETHRSLYAYDQLSGKIARVFVAREIRFISYGREVFDDGSAIH